MRISHDMIDTMLRNAIQFVFGMLIGVGLCILLSYQDENDNPWRYLDNYSAQAKQEMCFAYDYGPTGVGKLFNELAGEEPAGTTDELEAYLEEKCN